MNARVGGYISSSRSLSRATAIDPSPARTFGVIIRILHVHLLLVALVLVRVREPVVVVVRHDDARRSSRASRRWDRRVRAIHARASSSTRSTRA